MLTFNRFLRATLAMFLAGVVSLGVAQQFEWVPPGGSQILVEVLAECTACDDASTLLAADRSKEEWQAYFEEAGAAESLSEAEMGTVVAYLALTAPVAEGELPESGEVEANALPMDGRLMTLQQCSACHSLAAPITQDWPLEQWVSHFEGPTHSTIGMEETTMRKIANYLANNTVAPEDLPAEIRGDAPGY